MKLDSKYFDSIRVKPDKDRQNRQQVQQCQWPGCTSPGSYRAPRGRGMEGAYLFFCLDHVRAYNKSYNYFAGMSDAEVASYQKSAITGHRPTWSSGVNAWAATGFHSAAQPHVNGYQADFQTRDPFDLFGKARQGAAPEEPGKTRRVVRNAERKCLRVMDLNEDSAPAEIKARFKLLVKRHHPDGNGGDRTSEDKLREVIQAYNYLKQAGFC